MTQQKEIERLEAAIRRFKDWAHRVVDERHIKQARNKQRQIDRMEKVDRPVLERRRIALRLHPHARGGTRVFDLRHVGVQFGEDVVLADVELTVLHGERIGVVGPNGAGKSVLLKTVVGELEPTEGEVWVGPSIRIGYLAQDQETLDPDASPLETVRLAHRCSEGEAVALLMKFLFPYEQVRRPNRLLSGGERTRLQLLLLMLAQPNLLVLDEPTNHLDIDSVEALEAALEEFDGTVCAISHDRYFLDRVVDRIVEVRDAEAVSFEGGYSDWFERRGRDAAVVDCLIDRRYRRPAPAGKGRAGFGVTREGDGRCRCADHSCLSHSRCCCCRHRRRRRASCNRSGTSRRPRAARSRATSSRLPIRRS